MTPRSDRRLIVLMLLVLVALEAWRRSRPHDVAPFILALAWTLGLLAYWGRRAVAHFRSVDRRLGGRCIRCGYDLTGNVSGVCPECGARR
jgi:hypothetical protein